jgi:membrane protein implicated in regulation of membrane protease activity
MPLSFLWLLGGVALCALETIVPTAFVLLTMGLSAIAIACLIQGSAAFGTQIGLQVGLWMVLSIGLTVLVRALPSRPKRRSLVDDTQGKTLTAIAPGETGRVLYEGNSWQARCADETLEIPADRSVYVVEHRGTTLVVMPEF